MGWLVRFSFRPFAALAISFAPRGLLSSPGRYVCLLLAAEEVFVDRRSQNARIL